MVQALVSRSHGRARRVGIGLLGLGATFVTIAASFLLPMFFAIRHLLRGIGQWRRAHSSRAIAGGMPVAMLMAGLLAT